MYEARLSRQVCACVRVSACMDARCAFVDATMQQSSTGNAAKVATGADLRMSPRLPLSL